MRVDKSRTIFLQVLVLICLPALFAAGCGGSASGTLPPSQQIFRFPVAIEGSTDIKTIDPALVQTTGAYVPVVLVFPALLTLNGAGIPMPWAASAMPSFDSAANTYTFDLRAGLRWSDGTPIDASTFAFSINRSLSPCTASAVTYYLFPIQDAPAYSTEGCGSDGTSVIGKIKTLIGDSIRVPNNQTLVLKLSSSAPYFLDALTYPTSAAQPEQLISRYGNKTWSDHLAANGGFGGNLFKVTLWDHKGDLDLVRNDAFWGTPARLHQIDYRMYQTQSAEYADFLDGRLDEASAPPLF